MQYISFTNLGISDAETISHLLLGNPLEYTQFFHPFDFEISSVQKALESRKKDHFFGVQMHSAASKYLAGFYMLRGLDEGYDDPMYGVFISCQYRGKGLARATISHAECFCKLNNHKNLLLKVHPENSRGKKLYESLGFKYLKTDPLNENIILLKKI